jgi:histidine triad (HIT) family protein
MNCLFCKIIDKTLPAKIVYENDAILAFHDISPQSPHHILIIPKKHLNSLNHASEQDQLLLGEMMLTAQKIAKQLDQTDNGYRLVMNIGNHGGQTVEHIHLHLLVGRPMHWPPG